MKCQSAMKDNRLDVQTHTRMNIKSVVLSGGKKPELRSVAQYHLWKLETRSQANQHHIFNKKRHTYSRTYINCIKMFAVDRERMRVCREQQKYTMSWGEGGFLMSWPLRSPPQMMTTLQGCHKGSLRECTRNIRAQSQN